MVMGKLLLKYWKSKLKIIEDDTLFKLFFIICSGLLFLLAAVIEMVCIKQNNIIGEIVIISLIVQYNRPAILLNLLDDKKCMYRISQKSVVLRFYFFQIMKENFMLIPMLAISIGIAVINIVINLYMSLGIIFVIIIEILVYYLGLRFEMKKKISRKVLYIKEYNRINKVIYYNITYFIRQPIKQYVEMILQIIVVMFFINYGFSVIMINYFLVILCIIDIEIYQDKEMNNYNIGYGKYAMKELSYLNKKNKFLLSNEFRIFLKYTIIEAAIIINGKLSIIGFILLMLLLAYKYFCGKQYVYKKRCLMKNTLFRMCMFYYVLIAIAPTLFKKEILKLVGAYNDIYGICFSIIVGLLGLMIPIEKISGLSGAGVDES